MTSTGTRQKVGWVAVVGIIGTIALAAGAFSLSFTSLMHLALRSGIDPSQAWEWPLIVDGMIIVASEVTLVLACFLWPVQGLWAMTSAEVLPGIRRAASSM